MHASIWRFSGDPDELLARYDAMIAELPDDQFRLHACLRTDDGILVVDTCPTRARFEELRASGRFAELLARHGMPAPRIADHPVHAAFANGRAVAL